MTNNNRDYRQKLCCRPHRVVLGATRKIGPAGPVEKFLPHLIPGGIS